MKKVTFNRHKTTQQVWFSLPGMKSHSKVIIETTISRSCLRYREAQLHEKGSFTLGRDRSIALSADRIAIACGYCFPVTQKDGWYYVSTDLSEVAECYFPILNQVDRYGAGEIRKNSNKAYPKRLLMNPKDEIAQDFARDVSVHGSVVVEDGLIRVTGDHLSHPETKKLAVNPENHDGLVFTGPGARTIFDLLPSEKRSFLRPMGNGIYEISTVPDESSEAAPMEVPSPEPGVIHHCDGNSGKHGLESFPNKAQAKEQEREMILGLFRTERLDIVKDLLPVVDLIKKEDEKYVFVEIERSQNFSYDFVKLAMLFDSLKPGAEELCRLELRYNSGETSRCTRQFRLLTEADWFKRLNEKMNISFVEI